MSLRKGLTFYAGVPHRKETALYALACAYSLVEKQIADYLRPFSLTPAKFNAMMVIKHIGARDGLSQIEIGRRLIVTASNMTRLIDKLANEGYIERFNRTGDRRINMIRISPKGSALLDKIWPGYFHKLSSLASLVGNEELRQLSSILSKFCDRLGGFSGEPASGK